MAEEPIKKNTTNINDLMKNIKQNNKSIETLAPNYKKSILGSEETNMIIKKIATDLDITEEEALAGTMLLLLKGASSDGTPQNLSVELKNGKTLAKRNVQGAYLTVTGNNYLRRLAESLAIQIGEFAEHFGLNGELTQRINTSLKAESGEVLSPKETAWCSSFSQNIPDLATRSSERLVRLLAEDYKKRFEGKKKYKTSENKTNKTNKRKKIK